MLPSGKKRFTYVDLITKPLKTNLLRTFCSKILLFGEYTVIHGSKALAIPYDSFQAAWSEQLVETQYPNLFAEMLSYFLERAPRFEAWLDLDAFTQAIGKGLYFKANIPVGYGLGSSGALTAAIYDRFRKNEHESLPVLKERLAQMESFFHGESSGIDPFIIYLNAPILQEGKLHLRQVNLPDFEGADYSIFLLNTGISRQTGTFVNTYLEQYKQEAYQQICSKELAPASDQCIDALLNDQGALVYENFKKISEIQQELFQAMIPPPIKSVWEKGLRDEQFYLKLCGAGGGGFMLGICKDFSLIKQEIPDFATEEILKF